jgi:hypothetical protein
MSRRVSIFGASFASGPSYLPETIAFLTANGVPDDGTVTAYGITGSQLWAAVDTYFGSLITDSLWSKLDFLYLYITGSAAGNKFNAINPLDSDAAFRLTFNGGVTHGLGMTGNGTNAWAETHYNLLHSSVNYEQDNASVGFYCISPEAGVYVDIGGSILFLGVRVLTGRGAASDRISINSDGQPLTPPATSDALGLYTICREDSAQQKRYRNGILIDTHVTPSVPLQDISLGLMTWKRVTNSAYSPRTYMMHYAGAAFDATDNVAFNTATQTFMTTLGVAV